MKVKKFKINEDGCIAVYTDNQETEISLKAKEQPLQSLVDSFQNLAQYVIEICELPASSGIEVTGLSLSFSHDIQGAVIVAKMKLVKSTGVINLVTPHRIEDFYAESGDEGQLMPSGMRDHVTEAIIEIERYIHGERAGKQEELFNDSAA
jgi:hypothetical protein